MTTLKEPQVKKRRLQGVVVSDKMDKTVVVAITHYRWHSKYRKQYALARKLKAHDEENQYRIGDTVAIQETRPRSKDKCWEVIELIERPETKGNEASEE